jgi:hypothetical protein
MWVGGLGFAWRRVEIDPNAGGERWIALRRQGEIQLRCAGLPQECRFVRARLYPADGVVPPAGLRSTPPSVAVDIPVEEATRRWLPLAAGPWVARLERHYPGAPALHSESVRFDVLEGTRTFVEVPYRADPVPERTATILFVLTLDGPDLPEGASIELRLRDGPPAGGPQSLTYPASSWRREASADGAAFICSSEPIPTGSYEVLLLPWQVRLEVGVESAGEHLVEIPLETPRKVLLRVRDPASGVEPGIQMCTWATACAPGLRPWRVSFGERAGEDRGVLLRIPRTEVRVRLAFNDGSSVTRTLNGRTCPDQVEWVLQPDPAVVISFEDMGQPVALAEGAWSHLTLRRGGELVEDLEVSYASFGKSRARSSQRISVRAAGAYELHVPDVDGYEAVPPVPLMVQAGVVEHARIRLVRRAP